MRCSEKEASTPSHRPSFSVQMRILAIFSFSFAAGIFLLQYGLLPAAWAIPSALFCLLIGWLSFRLRHLLVRWHIVLITAGLTLGLCWNWLYARSVQAPMLALDHAEQSAELMLCDYPTAAKYGARVPVKVSGFTRGKAIFYGDATLLDLKPGQTVQGLIRFKSASRIKDEDVTTFTSQGIYLLAYQRGELSYGTGSAESIRWLPKHLARNMQARIQLLFEGDVAAFLTAILTGNKQQLSTQAAADLSEAGLFHILAVSGMHCGYLLAMITLLIGKHRRRAMVLCAIPLLLFYAALTGGSPSVLRACAMLSLFIVAQLLNAPDDGWTSLAFALFLILLHNPFAAASVSLQLSFGAMAGILFLTSRLDSILLRGKERGKVYYFIVSGVTATFGALFFTIPLCALYFNTLVLISPVSNLLCLWAAGLIFTIGLLAVVLHFICPPLAAIVAIVPGLLARYILKAAHLLAAIPFHAAYFSNPYLPLWVLFVYLLTAILVLTRAERIRTHVLALGLSTGTLLLSLCLGVWRYHADLDAIIFDVGQGQSVLLASHGDFALLDCGSAQDWKDPGKLAAEQLRSMGCPELDYLLLTHYDTDHISGIAALMARLPVKTLLLPSLDDEEGLRDAVLETASHYNVSVREIDTLEHLPLGAAQLTIYPPLGKSGDNERGLSCLAACGDQDLLVTGDMSAATEQLLLDTYSLPDLEVLVAGHHGSKFSTSDVLLDHLTPDIAVISAGAGNRYGHPADETLWRLAEHNCTIYRTDLNGSIHLTFNQGDHNGI